jgi:hypothetical protein
MHRTMQHWSEIIIVVCPPAHYSYLETNRIGGVDDKPSERLFVLCSEGAPRGRSRIDARVCRSVAVSAAVEGVESIEHVSDEFGMLEDVLQNSFVVGTAIRTSSIKSKILELII